MKVDPTKYASFDYIPYLDRMDNPLPKKPRGCPYDIGDVVVVEETKAIGVVLGCICEDGDLRTDVDGMRCWSSPGYLRKATVKDLSNKDLTCSPKLRRDLLKQISDKKAGTIDQACVKASLKLHGLVKLGGHSIQEKDLKDRIIDKIPLGQFHSILMAIKKDLDNS
jgi:hypothetical protein